MRNWLSSLKSLYKWTRLSWKLSRENGNIRSALDWHHETSPATMPTCTVSKPPKSPSRTNLFNYLRSPGHKDPRLGQRRSHSWPLGQINFRLLWKLTSLADRLRPLRKWKTSIIKKSTSQIHLLTIFHRILGRFRTKEFLLTSQIASEGSVPRAVIEMLKIQT